MCSAVQYVISICVFDTKLWSIPNALKYCWLNLKSPRILQLMTCSQNRSGQVYNRVEKCEPGSTVIDCGASTCYTEISLTLAHGSTKTQRERIFRLTPIWRSGDKRGYSSKFLLRVCPRPNFRTTWNTSYLRADLSSKSIHVPFFRPGACFAKVP